MEARSAEFNRSTASTRPILDAKWDGRPALSVKEASEILGMSPWCVYDAAKRGKLPLIRLGRRAIVPRHALEQLLDVAPASRTAESPVT
jgi:excisionase family DNA binding protein